MIVKSKWTEEEIAFLREEIDEGVYYKDIAKSLHRSLSAVQKQAARLGITSKNKFLREKPAALLVVTTLGDLKLIVTNNIDKKLSELPLKETFLHGIWCFDTGAEAKQVQKQLLTEIENERYTN